jgi:hypothetical protein
MSWHNWLNTAKYRGSPAAVGATLAVDFLRLEDLVVAMNQI